MKGTAILDNMLHNAPASKQSGLFVVSFDIYDDCNKIKEYKGIPVVRFAFPKDTAYLYSKEYYDALKLSQE